MHRTYENEDIVFFWNSDKCFHAKRCVNGSPKTFRPGQKPWIKLDRAETKEIWQAISQCPSGALTCLYRHDIDVSIDPEKSLLNGDYLDANNTYDVDGIFRRRTGLTEFDDKLWVVDSKISEYGDELRRYLSEDLYQKMFA